MTTLSERVKQLENDAATGVLGCASTVDLEKYLAVLCEPNAYREFSDRQFPTLSETVRTLLLRAHIGSLQDHVVELHGHITDLNKKNALTQTLVIVLTVVSVIGSAIQIWYAQKADTRAEDQTSVIAAQPQPQTQQSPPSVPTPAKPPSSHPTMLPAMAEPSKTKNP